MPKLKVESLNLALPLVLLVPRKHKAKCADELLHAKAQDSLITLPAEEMIGQVFAEGQKELKIIWRPSLKVTALELIQHFVLEGY